METKDQCKIKAKKEVVSYEDFYIDMKDITLLSATEYVRYKDTIPLVDFLWWLRSPGYYEGLVANVFQNGALSYNTVTSSFLRVRPAIVHEPSSYLKIGSKVKLFEMNWTVLSQSLLLCDENIGVCAFREDWEAPDANVYETSDVKKYLHEWILSETRKEYVFKRRNLWP